MAGKEESSSSANREAERRRELAPLALSPERFEAVVHSISDGVLTVDREWRITCFNRAAEEITGYRRSEVLGRPCYEVLRSDLCHEACPIRHTVETGKPVAGLVVYITDAEDRKVPVSISTALFRDAQGRLMGGVETFRDLRQIEALKKQVEKSYTAGDIVSRNSRVGDLLDMLPVVAESDSTILIRGETGTGKELLARAVHNLSPRKKGPFVAVNCGCFPETLVDSELFGYEKGAFTGADRAKVGRFARAENGTLFLDEVGNLALPVQAKLLRVLQERTYEPLGGTRTLQTNARIVAATNQDLAAMVEEGTFRQDLYYRINVIQLDLPPLRERPEDVLPLIRHFIRQLALLHEKDIEGVTPEALRILMAHDYPGNIRELENIVEHGFVLAAGPLIGIEHLPRWLVETKQEVIPTDSLENCERRVILSALERNEGNRASTAEELGMHKSTLYRKMRRLGLLSSDASVEPTPS
ncbi:MAG: sigma 54-interacting transcriptional regulator [Gemmatimonadota bacterium]|jgi:PAS domain S-box-containing protein